VFPRHRRQAVRPAQLLNLPRALHGEAILGVKQKTGKEPNDTHSVFAVDRPTD